MKDEDGNTRSFYLHRSLLEEQSKGFAYHIHNQSPYKLPDEPAVTVTSISHAAFTDFVCWLYGHLSPDSSMLARLPALRKFAINWMIPEFDKYLLGWCDEHCGSSEWLQLLQELGRGLVAPDERLPDYALEKLAYEITSKGWMRFIEVAGENWRQFMSGRENTRYNCKSKYIARLMFKLEEAEKLNSEQKLTSPATCIHKWFPAQTED